MLIWHNRWIKNATYLPPWIFYAVCMNMSWSQEWKLSQLPKHAPPRTLNIPAHHREFIYYSTQPMSRAIFILSIFRSLGCFLVIPPHRVKNAVHLHIPDQFIFSHTTPVGFFTFITRFHSPEITIVVSIFSAVFFYRWYFSECGHIHLGLCVFLSIHHILKSTGPIRLLFFLLLKYIPDTTYYCLNTSPSYFICFSVLKSPQITN